MAGGETVGHSIYRDPTTSEKVNDQSDPKKEDSESSGNEKSGGSTDKILAEDHDAGQPEEAKKGDGLRPDSLGKELITDETPW
jgi:hypothetical protein